MTVNQHLQTFDQKTTFHYSPGADFDPQTQAPRLAWSYEDDRPMVDMLQELVDSPQAPRLEALIIGAWGEDMDYDELPNQICQWLIDHHDDLPSLQALFLWDMTYMEYEISWIFNTDLGPLLNTFSNLHTFGTRGGMELRFTDLEHDNLTSLTVQSGGLSSNMLNDLLQAKLPKLTHLELWLGTDNYGFDGDIETLKPFLHGNAYPELDYPFPKLDYLGLRNSSIADQIAATLHDAPVLKQVSTLDLSMGKLSEKGADALLQIEDWGKVERLDLSSNVIQDQAQLARLQALPLEVNVEQQREVGRYGAYVEVGE